MADMWFRASSVGDISPLFGSLGTLNNRYFLSLTLALSLSLARFGLLSVFGGFFLDGFGWLFGWREKEMEFFEW